MNVQVIKLPRERFLCIYLPVLARACVRKQIRRYLTWFKTWFRLFLNQSFMYLHFSRFWQIAEEFPGCCAVACSWLSSRVRDSFITGHRAWITAAELIAISLVFEHRARFAHILFSWEGPEQIVWTKTMDEFYPPRTGGGPGSSTLGWWPRKSCDHVTQSRDCGSRTPLLQTQNTEKTTPSTSLSCFSSIIILSFLTFTTSIYPTFSQPNSISLITSIANPP